MTDREPTAAPGQGPQGDDGLDALFAAARAQTPAPSAALVERVLADAAATVPRRGPLARPRSGLWSGLLRRPAEGSRPAGAWPLRPAPLRPREGRAGEGRRTGTRPGAVWPGAAGLAAALVAGLWVGAMPPAPLLALEEALLGPSVLLAAGDPADWPSDWTGDPADWPADWLPAE